MFVFSGNVGAKLAAPVFRLMNAIAVTLALVMTEAHAQSPGWETYLSTDDFKGFSADAYHLSGPHRLLPEGLELSDRSGFAVSTEHSPIDVVQVNVALQSRPTSRTVLQIGFQYPGRGVDRSVGTQLDVDPSGNAVVRLFAIEGQGEKTLRQAGIRGEVNGTWKIEVRYGHARVLLNDNPILETVLYSGNASPDTVVIGCLHGTVRLSHLVMMRLPVPQPQSSSEQQQVDNADVLTGEAGFARVQGDYSSAIEKAKQALAIYQRILGDQSFLTGKAKADLGTFLTHTDHLAQARDILEEAVESLRASAGRDHPQTAAAELSLANVLAMTRDFSRALPLAQHSLDVAERVYEPDDPTLSAPLSSIAGIKAELTEFDGAIEALRRAIKIRTDRFGAEDIHIAPYLQQLAELELRAKDFDRAIFDFETVKRIYANQGGKDPEGNIRATRNLAHAYGRLGKANMMRVTLQEALAVAKTAFSANDYRIGLLEADFATLELLTGDPREANVHARAALRIQLNVTLKAVLNLSEHEAARHARYFRPSPLTFPYVQYRPREAGERMARWLVSMTRNRAQPSGPSQAIHKEQMNHDYSQEHLARSVGIVHYLDGGSRASNRAGAGSPGGAGGKSRSTTGRRQTAQHPLYHGRRHRLDAAEHIP